MAAFFVILVIILVLGVAEAVMLFFVRHPAALRKRSSRFQNSMAYLYVQGERRVMQFQDGCGRYSPEFGYTLKPGEFTFSEREFSNRYIINSLGVRDSEDALCAPDLVVLGDSYALGWGVNQDETFTAQIGQQTRLKVLNTSVPSFGTVREMLMLSRIDRSNLKAVIIQYCGDDYDENLRFQQNGNRPQIMREETFRNLSRMHSREKHYYFGKYVRMKIEKKIKEAAPAREDLTNLPGEAELFLYVLRHHEALLGDLPIIVIDLGGKNRPNAFIKDLERQASLHDALHFTRRWILLDMTRYLKPDHFYVLDDHLTPEGHRVVAEVIVDALRKEHAL